jgi:PAP2 superfamily
MDRRGQHRDSTLWARDYNEVKEWGGTKSSRRSAWQTETARFWEIAGADAWNQAARALLATKPLPLSDSARLFMTLNLATADASLAVFDAKYHYGFWRPVTAIRNGDRDGNDGTERDAGWQPAIPTPMHPEYPCAHCVQDGAAGLVLKAIFGSGAVPEFTLTYAAMPGVSRKYSSVAQLEEEVAMARIWGGVHYRNSNEVGYDLGKRVADYVVKSVAAAQAQ